MGGRRQKNQSRMSVSTDKARAHDHPDPIHSRSQRLRHLLFFAGTVRIFGSENRVSDHYQVDLLKSYQIGKKLALSSGLFMGLIGLLTAGGISVVLW